MVYLIHLKEKLHHAQHYIGFVDEPKHKLKRRVEYHKSGKGSKFLKAVAEAGIEFDVMRTWKDGDRIFERKLKNQKNAKKLCPICNPKKTVHLNNGRD